MISFAVVAHPARTIDALAKALPGDTVFCSDDFGIGADANHLRAWSATCGKNSIWAAVLEDDALPVSGFLGQAKKALAAAPEPVVSLYLGTSRPRRWQERIPAALAKADRTNAHWLTAPHAIHAVAVAVHADLREDWLDYAYDNQLPIDERISAWCVARGHRVAYTVPSLCDHADGPTLIQHRDDKPRDAPRKAWRIGTREYWNSKTQAM